MKSILLAFFLIPVISCFAKEPPLSKIDQSILKMKLSTFAKDRDLPMGDLVLKIGLDFLNTPYVSKTLDKAKEENLVINLHQLDCTTFAENCLALARTIKGTNPDADSFALQLEKIRYRNGKLEGYTSRLHYFSEWILDNEAKGIVRSMAKELGGKILPLQLNIMSKNPQVYPQLINDPAATERIKMIEEKLSAQTVYYIPVNQFESIEPSLKDGDIVTLTTTIPGIDVSHVGILIRKDGRIHLLHASSSAMKVVISSEPFLDYLLKSKKTTGIQIARPIG